MKNLKSMIFCVLFCVVAATAFSQVDPKASVQNGVNDRANSRVDDGVNKGLDKIEHGVGSLFKKKRKPADSTKTTPAATNVQDLKYLVIINYKSTDATSKQNAEKLAPLLIAGSNDNAASYYQNDLSDANTAAASARIIKQMGLQSLQKSFTKPGTAEIVEISSSKIIKAFKLDLPAKEIEKNLKDAMVKAE